MKTQLYLQENEDYQASNVNIIKQTRKIIKDMTEQERIHKAVGHVNDALYFRQPRIDIHDSRSEKLFQIVYSWQVSIYWSWFLLVLTYIYFYLIALDHKLYYKLLLESQIAILIIYWFDIGMYLYHKSFEKQKMESEQKSLLYIKIATLTILMVDLIVFAVTTPLVKDPFDNIRYFSPFRFIRGLLPIIYDKRILKSVIAFLSTYKIIIICLTLYMIVVLTVTLISNQFLQFPQDWVYDEYKQNYPSFSRSIIIYYIISTYQGYPQNQFAAIRWSQWIYLLWHFFVLLNMFFIGNIPGPLIYNSFRQNKSKFMLMEQINQQKSLIIAFVCLSKNKDLIDNSTLIKFLLSLYKQKVRYVNYIADICLKMDENNNDSIQIRQFMQLTKILTKNAHMMPPKFQDFQLWIRLRRYVNQKFNLKSMVKSWTYGLIINLLIIAAFVNDVIFIQLKTPELDLLGNILLMIFFIDATLKIIGIGVQNYFNQKWNSVDFVLILVAGILVLVGESNRPIHSDKLIVMMRIFRIVTLIKLILYKNSKAKVISYSLSVYDRLRRLISYTLITIFVMIKFLPLFLLLFYYCSLVGMQLFHDAQKQPPTQAYGFFAQYSNFKQFVNSQYIVFQLLLEASFAGIVFDNAVRSRMYWPTIIYFIVIHMLLVIIMAPLFKGLLWEAYTSIQGQFQENRQEQIKLNLQQIQNQKKQKQFNEIRELIEQNNLIESNTIIKRQFIQNKLDQQILKKLKQLYQKNSHLLKSPEKKKRSGVIEHIIMDKKKYLIESFSDFSENEESKSVANRLYDKLIKQNIKQNMLQNIEKEDFQREMEQLMEKIVLDQKIQYNYTMVYPKVLIRLLEQKMINPFSKSEHRHKLDLKRNIIRGKEAIDFHVSQLNVLLGIQKFQKQQRKKVIKQMYKQKLIKQEQYKQLLQKDFPSQKSKDINSTWIMKNMFLGSIGNQFINKLQKEYFYSIYQKSYIDISKIQIQPLLRQQAQLIHDLKNILRYPQVLTESFFQLFSTIESRINENLLKKGSLFKFVYQTEAFSDNWFTVEYRQNNSFKIHFIKTGIWIYHQKMRENQIYYANDLFNWDGKDSQNKTKAQKVLKLLYQTFEGLSFGLQDNYDFFISNPIEFKYDLYSFFIDVTQLKRQTQRKLNISKIMLVILSKQEQRQEEQKLDYEISTIKIAQKSQNNLNFKYEESQRQTFQKLNNFSKLNKQKTIQTQGLPYAYILNLTKQIKDITNLFKSSLTNHVQKVLNEQFFKQRLQ